MIVSDNRAVGQVGTTIGLGLLFDTLIVRSFMTPSIAALLGRWFWWPMNVRSRLVRASTQRLSGDAGFEDVAETEVTAPLANGNGALTTTVQRTDTPTTGTGSLLPDH
jgi:putative drug exporter of the RND superfamily